MKKMIACICLLLSLCFLLAACNTPKKEATDTSSTQGTDSPPVMQPGDATVEDCEAPGYFSNLEDFYTYATTGSRNSEDYSDPYTAENISWYKKVDPVALLKLEDVLGASLPSEKLEYVHVWLCDNHYRYGLDAGGVTIDYDSSQFGTDNEDLIERYSYYDEMMWVTETQSNQFSLDALDQPAGYIKKIGDATVIRMMVPAFDDMKKYYFVAHIDGYRIKVEYLIRENETLEGCLATDEVCQRIFALFENDQLEENVARLKACVEANRDLAS